MYLGGNKVYIMDKIIFYDYSLTECNKISYYDSVALLFLAKV